MFQAESSVFSHRFSERLILLLQHVLAVLLLLLVACSTPRQGVYQPKTEKPESKLHKIHDLKPGEFFQAELETTAKQFASPETIKAESAKIDSRYRIGPGDVFSFLVRGRPDATEERVLVSPDGNASLPRIGIVHVQGMTVDELTELARHKLSEFYENPEVTVIMREFNNNRVFVLGRVANPGAVKFQGQGTLLEALSLAGGLPTDTEKTFLSRCMIVRGDNLVMWIDLRELLENGNMALNAKLRNGDVIFIPQSEDQLAYVLGEVARPGVLTLRSQMTLLDAIMSCGGPTKGANTKDVFIVRTSEGKGVVKRVDLANISARGDFRENYVLKDGDLILVPPTGLSRMNYFLTQIQPFFTIIGLTTGALSNVGLMDALIQ